MNAEQHQWQLVPALTQITLPSGIEIYIWSDGDSPAIQRLSSAEGWTSPILQPDDSLLAWKHSWAAPVAIEGEVIVGFVRGFSAGATPIPTQHIYMHRPFAEKAKLLKGLLLWTINQACSRSLAVVLVK